jgi:hypothetical protein
MAKVGSLNLIKQFSSAQGEDKHVRSPAMLPRLASLRLLTTSHCMVLF